MRGCHLGKTLYFQNFMCMETKYVYHILCIMYYLIVLHVYLTIFYVFFLIKYKKKRGMQQLRVGIF